MAVVRAGLTVLVLSVVLAVSAGGGSANALSSEPMTVHEQPGVSSGSPASTHASARRVVTRYRVVALDGDGKTVAYLLDWPPGRDVLCGNIQTWRVGMRRVQSIPAYRQIECGNDSIDRGVAIARQRVGWLEHDMSSPFIVDATDTVRAASTKRPTHPAILGSYRVDSVVGPVRGPGASLVWVANDSAKWTVSTSPPTVLAGQYGHGRHADAIAIVGGPTAVAVQDGDTHILTGRGKALALRPAVSGSVTVVLTRRYLVSGLKDVATYSLVTGLLVHRRPFGPMRTPILLAGDGNDTVAFSASNGVWLLNLPSDSLRRISTERTATLGAFVTGGFVFSHDDPGRGSVINFVMVPTGW